jgi:hypothetical protein
MNAAEPPERSLVPYPVDVHLDAETVGRNRLTTAFRIFLAIPHLLLVGGPMAAVFSWAWTTETGVRYDWGAGGGVLGAVAGVSALIAWFAIVFTTRHPEGLWTLAAFYLRWRVRAVAYTALLTDAYPPFGEGAYPAVLEIARPDQPRDRLTVGFRLILAIPHLLAVWVLGVAWGVTTAIAWVAILLTGDYPAGLYRFGVGVLRWNTRVEAYILLLRDEYPPFTLD